MNKSIGGSEIAAVMGLSRYCTPLELWARKTGRLAPPEDQEHMELGRELEDFVARKFMRKSGLKIMRDTREFVHEKYPYLVGHIDRRVVGGELLECKTASAWLAKDWQGEDIPQEYILQVIWYLGLLKMKRGYIACLIGGQKFVWKTIDFNPELFDNMVKSAVNFWENYVLTDIPPMATADDKDTLTTLYPKSKPELSKVLTNDEELEFNQLVEIRTGGIEQIKQIEVEIETSENRLRQILGECEFAETGQHRVTWKTQNQTRVDTEALKKAGLYDQYSKTSTIRVLRAYAKKEK